MTSARPDTRLLIEFQSAFITAAHRVRAAGSTATITSNLNSDNGAGAVVLYATPGVNDSCAFGAAWPYNALDLDVLTNGVGTCTITC